MNSQTCPYPVIPLTLTSPIPECFAFFIARSIANLPMAGPFFSKREHQILFHVIQIYRRGLWITLWLIAYQECCCRPRELWICSPWLWLVRYPVRQILPYFPNISRTTLDVKGSLYDMSTYSLAGCFSFMYLFLRKCLFQTTRCNELIYQFCLAHGCIFPLCLRMSGRLLMLWHVPCLFQLHPDNERWSYEHPSRVQ